MEKKVSYYEKRKLFSRYETFFLQKKEHTYFVHLKI